MRIACIWVSRLNRLEETWKMPLKESEEGLLSTIEEFGTAETMPACRFALNCSSLLSFGSEHLIKDVLD